MKTMILSAAAITALLGAATAAPFNEQTGTVLERRFDAHGNTFFVHVRPAQQTTTVALFRRGHGLGQADRNVIVREVDRPVVLNRRVDPHGHIFLEYGPPR